MRAFSSLQKWFFLAVAAAPTMVVVGGCSSASPAESPYDFDSGVTSGDSAATDSSTKPDGAAAHDGSAASDAARAIDSSSSDASDGGSLFVTPDAGPGACDPVAVWATGSLLAASTAGDDQLDSITPDELSIAWTSGSAILYADRTSTGDAFGSPQNLEVSASIPIGTYIANRVALSPDGLRLVVVNADAQGFSEFTRPARMGSGNTFQSPAVGAFTNIDLDTPDGGSVGDPVIGASDTTFFYSLYGVGATKTVYRSLRLLSTDAWSNGAALAVASALEAQGDSRRRPTAISSDNRTLFFYDEVSSTERASWINETTGTFDTFVDLGARVWAAPNSACSSLYYSSAGTSSVDLSRATH